MDITKLIANVESPARYMGGEYNTPKIKENASLRYLMCFPDIYEVAMSNLGIRILYYMLNRREDTACERCFTPALDLGAQLKSTDTPLFSLETKTPIAQFDILGFSLQYELSYTNILYMLDLGKIPFLSRDRDQTHPIIMAGGPCAVNPEPLADIVDIFVIGDGEEVLNSLAELFVKNKNTGGDKNSFFKSASKLEGVYVPSLKHGLVKRAVLSDLNEGYFPDRCQVANIEAVHDRPNLELFRGCIRGCRFCQAGFIYRPLRERKPDKLLDLGKNLLKTSGFEELSLASLSTSDYSQLRELLEGFREFNKSFGTRLSLPSLRLDSFDSEYTFDSKINSLTFAPEAGTQRLRDVINKNITLEHIKSAMTSAFSRGYGAVKLYFMLGLPTETDEDVAGIVEVARFIKRIHREQVGRGRLNISVSTSTFIPKPFTPFQWDALIDEQTVKGRQDYLKHELRKIGVKYNFHDYATSRLEAIFARGDTRLNQVLIKAYQDGAVFDGWSEHFKPEVYENAFKECGIDANDYIKQFDLDCELAWDFINIGVSKKFLLSEYHKSRAAQTTPDCRTKCSGCGLAARCAVGRDNANN